MLQSSFWLNTVVLIRNQQTGGARLEVAMLASSTTRRVSAVLARHWRSNVGTIRGALAACTQGRRPKWQKSQQCERLCSWMPHASVVASSSIHTISAYTTSALLDFPPRADRRLLGVQHLAPAPFTNYFVLDTWPSVQRPDCSVLSTSRPTLTADCSVFST
jgi:hypothetical protein